MLPPGHIAGGYLAGRLAVLIYTQLDKPNFFIWTAFFGFIPDLDFFFAFFKSKKMIYQENVNHHNFPTHAPLLYLVVFALWYWLFPESRIVAYAFIIGTWSHFILDSFSVGGIAWLYPFTGKLYSLSLDGEITVLAENFIQHWTEFVNQYTQNFTFKLEIILIISAALIYLYS